jgi:quercetin dioxygenase-like cupin family protein
MAVSTTSVTVSAVEPGGGEAALHALGLRPNRWSAGPGAPFAAHTHARHKVLLCEAGEITFTIGSESWAMHPGDRLDLPAGTVHTAIAGPSGVTCIEAFEEGTVGAG